MPLVSTNWTAGIDLGGTNLKAVAVTPTGEVLRRENRTTISGRNAAAAWIAQVRTVIDDFAIHCGGPPQAIGLCAPGLASPDGRRIAHLPHKLEGITQIDWTESLGETRLVPVLNDAHAALLGETWIGAAQGRRHVVMFTLGTGVGGAVLSDGRLMRGALGRAGHVGHLSVDLDGERTIVGTPGGLEVMIGDYTVAARTGGRFTTTAELVAAHGAGDAEATRVWLRSIRALACAIGSCINLFDPELIVLGGGIALAGKALFEPLQGELDGLEWRPTGPGVPVVPATLGEWAGGIGAAAHAMRWDPTDRTDRPHLSA